MISARAPVHSAGSRCAEIITSVRHLREAQNGVPGRTPILLLAMLTLLGTFPFIAGCSTTGNPLIKDETRVQQIKTGVTTKAEVKNLLGDPFSTSKVNSNGVRLEVWNYHCREEQRDFVNFVTGGLVGYYLSPGKSTTTVLMIAFTEGGIVQSVNASQMGPE